MVRTAVKRWKKGKQQWSNTGREYALPEHVNSGVLMPSTAFCLSGFVEQTRMLWGGLSPFFCPILVLNLTLLFKGWLTGVGTQNGVAEPKGLRTSSISACSEQTIVFVRPGKEHGWRWSRASLRTGPRDTSGKWCPSAYQSEAWS